MKKAILLLLIIALPMVIAQVPYYITLSGGYGDAKFSNGTVINGTHTTEYSFHSSYSGGTLYYNYSLGVGYDEGAYMVQIPMIPKNGSNTMYLEIVIDNKRLANRFNLTSQLQSYYSEVAYNLSDPSKYQNTSQQIWDNVINGSLARDNGTFQYKLINSSNITCINNQCWYNGTSGSADTHNETQEIWDNVINDTIMKYGRVGCGNLTGGDIDFCSDADFCSGGTCSGNLIVNGNFTVLDNFINASVENQYLNGTFYPSITNLFDIGSVSLLWRVVYATTLQGSLGWKNLTDYPDACVAGSAVTQIDDTLTCSAFQTGTEVGNCSTTNSCGNIVYYNNASFVTSNQAYNTTQQIFDNVVNNGTAMMYGKVGCGNITGADADFCVDANYGADGNKGADNIWLYNDSTTIYFNDTYASKQYVNSSWTNVTYDSELASYIKNGTDVNFHSINGSIGYGNITNVPWIKNTTDAYLNNVNISTLIIINNASIAQEGTLTDTSYLNFSGGRTQIGYDGGNQFSYLRSGGSKDIVFQVNAGALNIMRLRTAGNVSITNNLSVGANIMCYGNTTIIGTDNNIPLGWGNITGNIPWLKNSTDVSSLNMTTSNLKTCNIETDANGQFICGVDDTGSSSRSTDNLWLYNDSTTYYFNQSYGSAQYVNRSLWTTIDNYPNACTAGQYVSALADTLTCAVPYYVGNCSTTNSCGNIVYNNNITSFISNNTDMTPKTLNITQSIQLNENKNLTFGLANNATMRLDTANNRIVLNSTMDIYFDKNGTYLWIKQGEIEFGVR